MPVGGEHQFDALTSSLTSCGSIKDAKMDKSPLRLQ